MRLPCLSSKIPGSQAAAVAVQLSLFILLWPAAHLRQALEQRQQVGVRDGRKVEALHPGRADGELVSATQ